MAVARHDSGIEVEPEFLRAVPVWDGIVSEFRNHLTSLLAAASEIRAVFPPGGPQEIAEVLAETEWNVQRLNALVGLVDGALRDGTPVIADLDDVVGRALRLAAPTLGRTTVSVRKERRTGVSNRGSALESLLAALLVELVRADGKAVAGERPLQIEIHVEVTRSTMFLSIESDGRRPSGESWRFALASDLAARLGAAIANLPDGAGYLVRFT